MRFACGPSANNSDNTLIDLSNVMRQFEMAMGAQGCAADISAYIAHRLSGRSRPKAAPGWAEDAPHDRVAISSGFGVDGVFFFTRTGRYHTAKL